MIVGNSFEGFTIIPVRGYWRGKEESSIIIEIWSNRSYAKNAVYTIAEEIKIANKQEAVLVQEIAVNASLV